MTKIYKIYDNGGKTVDRYSVLTENFYQIGKEDRIVTVWECLNLSKEPTHPTYGVSMFGDAVEGEHLGREIKFYELPKTVKQHVINRLSNHD